MTDLHPFWWGAIGAAAIWLLGVIGVMWCFGVSRFAPGPDSDTPPPSPANPSNPTRS